MTRAPIDHELKCEVRFYADVESGLKPFEFRRFDRDFAVGDTLVLREWDIELNRYTGRSSRYLVTYLLDLGASVRPPAGLPHAEGATYCVLGIVAETLVEAAPYGHCEWRFHQGQLSSGEMRFISEKLGSIPVEDFKARIMSWACQALNLAGLRSQAIRRRAAAPQRVIGEPERSVPLQP